MSIANRPPGSGETARGRAGPAVSVLHVVVGHEQPTYFLNAIAAVRAAAPGDPVLVVDNASTDPLLLRGLHFLDEEDERVEVLFRHRNDVTGNGKVGDLYAAYTDAFARAIARGADLLHLVQADFQVLWWDDELVARSLALFEAHPRCVNLWTQFPTRDMELSDNLVPSSSEGIWKLARYGLTDTGLFHLGRWQQDEMRFDADETLHAARYLAAGYEVLCHPWPMDAAIPWPAVVRRGVERGSAVRTRRPFLLQPLDPPAVARLKAAPRSTRHEDVVVPWGWLSLVPTWTTDADSIDYWVLRYRRARRDGLLAALPRFDRRGVPAGSWPRLLLAYEHRPPLWRLVLIAPTKAAWRWLRARGRPVEGRAGRRGRRRSS